MTHEEILRELALLPPEDRRQVEDFIAFLRARHKHSQAREESESSDLAQESFIGIWRDREDMQDSIAWVRSGRETEWIKHG